MQAHRVSQRFDHADAVDAPRHLQGEAGPAVLVDQRQDAQAPAVVGLSLHKVEAPDVIAVDWAQPHARTVVEPKSATRPVFLRDLQPLATPEALNPVLAHLPAICLQQHGDAAVAVAPVLGRQGDDGLGQCILIGRHGRHGALRAAVLTDDPAGVTFRETVRLPDADHCLPASLGGYKVPEATSANT
ncbi:hypothetical protein ABIE45_005632 [Methylobacterium sp. OAE515]